MTDTSQAEEASGQPQTNGFADDGLNDEERGKMRPADIDADVREMERRKRVEMIMNSRLFREELERIIESQMKEGGSGPGGLLQQLSDMMGPGVGRLQSANMFRSPNCVVPINDIRGVESMGYAKGEKLLRCKLAAVYRLIDLYGWTQGIHNHITARLNQDEEQFLVNPWGMLYHEVTASSLVKVDMQGNIVEGGTTNFGVNREGFKLHAAIHSARPDIKCIIHTHTSSVVAVSSLKTGLLPLCHEALVIGEVSTHPYIGGIFEPEEQEKIARNLGPINKVLFLTNHGAVCCGETVEEAFFNVYNTVQACDTQVKLMPLGVDNLVLLPDESRKRVYDAARRPPEGHVLDKGKEVTSPTIADRKEKRWRVGGTEFEALMRMLDNAGFRTGYIYRNPLVKGDPPRPRNDIEVPPAVSSLGYLLEEEELYKQGGWKKFGKTHDRTRWLNSPNVYQKVEILETGTPDPKKITKWVDANADEWVADGSPTHSSTPVKINTLQFVPKNTNPKEFKKLQQQIKDNRRADKITSGPQSHILEGVSWEEAKKMQDANISQTGDQVILVGAASKGIIQRGFQHNAMVYKAPYAKNPFDTVTEEELEEYKRAVDRKARGDHYDDSESEALSSSAAAARPPTGKSPTSPTSDEESRDEHRVLRIETKHAPMPIQAEVVLSDDSDYPDAIMERSKSARFPVKATPDLVTVPSGIGRSWSLGRNKRSNRADSQASSRPRLNTATRHFHHARYMTLPLCEGPARPGSPCAITRFSAVPEPSSHTLGAARPIPFHFHFPYPSYPTLSTSSFRSSARSISSSVDSIADDMSIPCGGSASSVSHCERLSETVRARLTELPRADRIVVGNLVDCPKEEVSVVVSATQDEAIKVQLDDSHSRSSMIDFNEEADVRVASEKTEEVDAETFSIDDGQIAGEVITECTGRLLTKEDDLQLVEEELNSKFFLEGCEEHGACAEEAALGTLSESGEQTSDISEQFVDGTQEDENDATLIFQGRGDKLEEEIVGEKTEGEDAATVGESCEDFADEVAPEDVTAKYGDCEVSATVEMKNQDTAREIVDKEKVAEHIKALEDPPYEEQAYGDVGKEEQIVSKQKCVQSEESPEKIEVAARLNGSKVNTECEVFLGDKTCKTAEEEDGGFAKDGGSGEHLPEEGEGTVVQDEESGDIANENGGDFIEDEKERGHIEKECADSWSPSVGKETMAYENDAVIAEKEVHGAFAGVDEESEAFTDKEGQCEDTVDKKEECEAEATAKKEVEVTKYREEEYGATEDEKKECETDEAEEPKAAPDDEGMCETDEEEKCEASEDVEEACEATQKEEEACEATEEEDEACEATEKEKEACEATAVEEEACETTEKGAEACEATAVAEEACEATAVEEGACEATEKEEEAYEATEKEEYVCEATAVEEEACEATEDEEEACEATEDEQEACEATEDEQEACEATEDEHVACEATEDEHVACEGTEDEEEACGATAVEEEACGATNEDEACETTEKEEEACEATEDEEEACEATEDEQEACEATEDEHVACEATEDEEEACGATAVEEEACGATNEDEACETTEKEEEACEATALEAEACEATEKEEEAYEATEKEEYVCEATEKEEYVCDATAVEEEACDATEDEEEACEATAVEEAACEATEKEEEACEATEKEEEACEATALEAEACEATEDEHEACEATEDEQEACEATEDEYEACEATAVEEEACVATEDEEEACVATEDEEEACVATEDEEACEATEDEACEATEDEEACEATEDEEEAFGDKRENFEGDEENVCDATREKGKECEAVANVEKDGKVDADDSERIEAVVIDNVQNTGEYSDFLSMRRSVTVMGFLATQEESATSITNSDNENPGFSGADVSSTAGERDVKSVFSGKYLAEGNIRMTRENAFSGRPRRSKNGDITKSKDNLSNGKRNHDEQKDDCCDNDQVFPAADEDTSNDLTFVFETLGKTSKASDKSECYQHLNDLVVEAVSEACNATIDDEYCESFPQSVCDGVEEKEHTVPPREDNLQWDFSDMALWEEDSDYDTTFHAASDTLSSSKSFHFGEEAPKFDTASWDRRSLPCLDTDFRTGLDDDTVSVKSWKHGTQYLKQEEAKRITEADKLDSSGEADDLEWSGAFTGNNTFDEGSWNRRDRRRAVSCGSEGGKEALFDLEDAPLSDQFFSPFSSPDAPFHSPVSPSYFNKSQGHMERTPALRTKGRSSSVGDLVPVNTFRFSWNSSKDLPKVRVTQTVSLTGSLTNKRVDVETTVVSERDGGKCVMTKVSCSPAGDVRGHLCESKAESSPLEIGRVFTLKNRKHVDS